MTASVRPGALPNEQGGHIGPPLQEFADGSPEVAGRKTGGERGIRTLGGSFPPHSLSRRAPSATRSSLRLGFSVRYGRFQGHVKRIYLDRSPDRGEQMAEGVGFEPTDLPVCGFQDRCLKPLGHPSTSVIFYHRTRVLSRQGGSAYTRRGRFKTRPYRTAGALSALPYSGPLIHHPLGLAFGPGQGVGLHQFHPGRDQQFTFEGLGDPFLQLLEILEVFLEESSAALPP